MKNQYGKVSNGLLLSLVAGGIFLITAITVITSYVAYYDYGAVTENTIKAEYKNMENILAQYSLKVAEAAQVPGMYKDDLKEVMTSVMTARMGADGSKAAFQWFKEHQVNISPEMYVKIQRIIEAGRNKFENAQTKFIDTKRAYQTNLDKLWSGFWLRVTGYPKINLDEYKIISSSHAQKTFKTGVDKGLKLR